MIEPLLKILNCNRNESQHVATTISVMVVLTSRSNLQSVFSLLVLALLAVPGAGGRCLLAGPEGDVCSQVPATGGDDGKPNHQPGDNFRATGPPLH